MRAFFTTYSDKIIGGRFQKYKKYSKKVGDFKYFLNKNKRSIWVLLFAE